MKIWTYEEMKEKILRDLDLEDETFITPDEMIGYFNEALTEAESEIITINEDYFLSKYFVPIVQGESLFELPYNLFANKIRSIMYHDGAIIYEIVRLRRPTEFIDIEYTIQYGNDEYYQYILLNDVLGRGKLKIYPNARVTAILPPQSGSFTPVIMWYIRNCNRVPLIGEFCNPELVAPDQVDIGADTIQTYSGDPNEIGVITQGIVGGVPGSIAYITGDAIQFQPSPGGTIPGPLVAGTTYYAIATGSGVIKVATSRANALAGTAINLTSQGSVSFVITVAATTAIINAELMDIPEFATFVMQWVKCRCMEKEGDPRLESASALLVQQKKQMVDTLTNGIVDDHDTVRQDFSLYREMS